LVLLVSVLLYIPVFQNFVVKKAAAYASESTGMTIHIDRIRLTFPLYLTVDQVEVLTAPFDTLVSAKSLSVDIKLLPLLRKEVAVNSINLAGVHINTGDFIDEVSIKGTLGRLSARADRIDLIREVATLNSVELYDSDLSLVIMNTVAKEDSSATVNWKIGIEKAKISDLDFRFRMESDSMHIHSYIGKAELAYGLVDLGAKYYEAGSFLLEGSSFAYDANDKLPEAEFDSKHIALDNLCFHLDSVSNRGLEFGAIIRDLYTQERSGFKISSLTGSIQADSTLISIPQLVLRTPYSEARLLATIPWETLKEKGANGTMRTLLTANIGKGDVILAAGHHDSTPFARNYPDKKLALTAGIEGNLAALNIRQVKAEMPEIFLLNLSGQLGAVTDSIKRSADISFYTETGNTDFLLSLLPQKIQDTYDLPDKMTLEGKAGLNDQEYRADVLFTESSGKVRLDASYNLKTKAYEATAGIDSLEPIHFMPQDSLLWLNASIEMKGQGYDLFSASTWSTVNGKISDIHYGKMSVSDILFNGSLKEHQYDAKLTSGYPLAKMNLTLTGSLEKEQVSGMLIADVDTVDLQGFHLTEEPLAMSFQIFSEFKSDFDKLHELDLTLGNWNMTTSQRRARSNPKMLTLLLRSNPDTTRVSLHTGDLSAILTGASDLMTIQEKLVKAHENVLTQIAQDSIIDVEVLRPYLPEVQFKMNAYRDNPIYNILQQNYSVYFSGLELEAATSPEEGLHLDAGVFMLVKDSLLLDTVRVCIIQDTLGFTYSADVVKKRYLGQESFVANLQGKVRKDFADAELLYVNQAGEKGLELGIRADKVEEGIRVQLFPEQVILAFHPFILNQDNHIHIKNIRNIDADLRLTGMQNRSLWIHSIPGDEKMEELHLELTQFDLDVISGGFSFVPDLQGIFSADLQYAPMDNSYMLAANANVDNLFYEGTRVGEIMLNATYLPVDDNSSQIDIHLLRDRAEISSLTAFYQTGRKDYIEGNVNITDLPLEMFTPFIPQKMASLNGALQGDLSFIGNTESPLLNGFIQVDTASVYVEAAGSRFRFDDKPIAIKDNLLSFDKYRIFASGNNPLTIDGNINMNNPKNMMADITMTANNMELINAARNRESLVYGRVSVNMNSTIKGPIQSLAMRGDLQVLGNTNVTYVMTESPLTVQDRLSGLVTFTSFGDTLFNQNRRRAPLPIGGTNILMTLKIDPAVQLKVDLTPDQSNRVELEGGGDLAFQYTSLGDMLMNGRYTLSGGTVRYKLPVVSTKNFTIQNGSYVEWNGELMNPRLNITATERQRASAAPEGATARMVNFDVGIKVQQTFENMALDFTLDAPEDMAIQSDLVRFGEEERRKQAVALMVSGVYLGRGGSASNLNMGNALNNFLSNEINNIAGSALKNVDLSFGMESYDESGMGANRTDYTFQFAKRFYNDRIRMVVGARLSSGNSVEQGQDDNFIDNVSLEYRLDTSGNRYVKLFHNKNYESILEGEITETGAGIVLKRKMRSISELFNFRKRKAE